VLLIVGTVRLPADRLPDARPIMREMIEASRAGDGCLA
jgi:quinol monooxygenase YgiN